MLPGDVRLAIFEDPASAEMGALALTRPTSELVLGAATLRERLERHAGRRVEAAAVRAHLVPLLPDLGLGDLARQGAAREGRRWRLVHAALVADAEVVGAIAQMAPGTTLATPEGRTVALRPGSQDWDPGAVCRGLTGGAAKGFAPSAISPRLLRHSWELIAWQPSLLEGDLKALAGESEAGAARVLHEGGGPGDVVVVRGRPVLLKEDVLLDPPLVLDARRGPIVLSAGVRVGPFSHLIGPLFAGPGARLLGGRIAASYIGAGCRVRGEIEASTLLGCSNKAHEGFLGHSYVGSWVNLGAGTTTSDLKNTYGIVRVESGGHRQPSGLRKLGSLIGDHAKTAIGTLLGAGSEIGPGASVHGCAGVAPRRVPAFAWGCGPGAEAGDAQRILAVAARVTARRAQQLSAAEQTVLRALYDATRGERERFLASQRG